MTRSDLSSTKKILITCLVVILFGGLLLKGANTAALAALFGMILMGLVVAVCLIPSNSPPAAQTSRPLPAPTLALITAAGIFLIYVILTIIPNPLFPAHPVWALIPETKGVVSVSPYRTVEGLANLAAPAAAYVTAQLLVGTGTERQFFFRVLMLFFLIFALYALAMHAAGINYNARMAVYFGSANSAATIFYMATIISTASMAIALSRQSAPAQKPIHGSLLAKTVNMFTAAPLSLACFLLSTASLFLTASRAGLICGMAGIIVCMTIILFSPTSRTSKKTAKSLRRIMAAVVGALAVLGMVGLSFTIDRLDRLDSDYTVRQVFFQTHWEVFLERPWTGHGLNSFHELNQMAATSENWQLLSHTGSVHNIYIQALEELGIIGTALLAIIVLLAAYPVILRSLDANRVLTVGWAAAAAGSLIAILLHGFVDFGLQTPAISALIAAIMGAFGPATFNTPRRRRLKQTPPSSTRKPPSRPQQATATNDGWTPILVTPTSSA